MYILTGQVPNQARRSQVRRKQLASLCMLPTFPLSSLYLCIQSCLHNLPHAVACKACTAGTRHEMRPMIQHCITTANTCAYIYI